MPEADPPEESHGTNPAMERALLELKSMRRQYEKLTIEVRALRDVKPWERWVSRLIPVISSLIAVSGFLFGVYQYTRSEAKARDERNKADVQAAKAQENAARSALEQ